MKALLASLLLTTQALAAPLDAVQTLSGQVLLPADKISISDTSPDNASPLLVHDLALAVAGFDASQGVLTGVSGRLTIDPGHGLMAYRNESGGNWESISTLRAGWMLGGQALGAYMPTLQRVVSDRDVKVVIGTDWAELSFSTSAGLDRFVSNGALPITVSTSLGAFISGGGGGSTASAAVLAMNNGVGGPDGDGLTAGGSWTYQWLRHAQLSFSAGVGQSSLGLDLGAGASAFSLHALGDAATTGADLLGWSCTGDCGAFSLQLGAAQGLAAGGSLVGSASFLGGAGAHAATYLLQVADDATVGAAASRGAQTLELRLSVAAPVPEPQSAWLLLAGMGALAWYRRRR